MKINNKTKIIGISIGILAVIFIFGIMGQMGASVPVRVATAEKGAIQSYVEERGRTSLPHVYHVTMPMQGRILPMIVEEGDFVKVGQVVARIEDSDWQDATRETASIIVAVDNWIEAVEAQVKASKIWQDYTKWEWEADTKLKQDSFVSEKQERESRRRYLDSSVKIEESQAMFHMSKAIQSVMDILPTYVKRNLDRTIVKSPVSGTVLKRHVWNEKVMSPGEPVLEIGNLDELEITSDILTESAVHIVKGDNVEIFGEVMGGDKVEGVVRLVEPEAFTKMSSLGVEEQRVTVKVSFTDEARQSLENSGKNIGLQYRTRVKIITAEKQDAVIVPRTSLFRGMQGQWQVYKKDKNNARLADVKVGILNDFQAEIISGINEGEKVIVAPESSISDGTKVESMEL